MAMAKLIFKSGGPGKRPILWRISRHPGLSRDYEFAPGVPTSVDDQDVAFFLEPKNTGGRVFEVAPSPGRSSAPEGRQAPTSTASAAGTSAGGTGDSAAARRPTQGAAGPQGGSGGLPTEKSDAAGNAPAGD